MDYRLRQQKLLRMLEEQKLHALLITHLPNIAYLCGFTGSAGVLVVRAAGWALFTDGRYTTQARQQVQGARVVLGKASTLVAAATWLNRVLPRTAARAALGIEAEHMTVSMRRTVAGLLPKRSRFVETSGSIERLRMIKDAEEIERIRAAVVAGASLLESALGAIRPGVSESAVAGEIEHAARRAGCGGMSFPTIVAAGPRSALPHGVASNAPLPAKGFVVLDFGVILAGYCSDMTRTVHLGRPSAEMRRVYEAVREAQQAGLEAVRAGVEAGQLDRAARQALGRCRLARYFTHASGHGVGLEIHEPPRVARGVADLLEPGMVITMEPGVYLPGKGGVRIEDMLVVTERGCTVLTPTPKDLITL